jgi:hypothetical protein
MASEGLGRRAILRVPLEGPWTADQLARGFAALESSYDALYLHEHLQQRALRLARSPRTDKFRGLLSPFHEDRLWYARGRSWVFAGWPVDDPLLVVRLHFASPGEGDLSGAAGPLETLRKTFVDRNERRKDREWREDLDRQAHEAELELRRREQEKLRAETAKIRAETSQLEAEAEQTRIEAEQTRVRVFRENYELIAGIAGVEEARKWAAQQLAVGAPAIEALSGDEVPKLLEPPDTPPG